MCAKAGAASVRHPDQGVRQAAQFKVALPPTIALKTRSVSVDQLRRRVGFCWYRTHLFATNRWVKPMAGKLGPIAQWLMECLRRQVMRSNRRADCRCSASS